MIAFRTLAVLEAEMRKSGAYQQSSQGRQAMIVTWLESTARALVASGRGLLAADESHAPIEKRFAALGIESTVDNRRVDRGSRQRWSRSSHSPTP